MHQQLNNWLVERGVIPRQFINNRAYVEQALRSGQLTESMLKRELYLFYRTKYPNLPGIPKALAEAF
jgi:hypothetical protein